MQSVYFRCDYFFSLQSVLKGKKPFDSTLPCALCLGCSLNTTWESFLPRNRVSVGLSARSIEHLRSFPTSLYPDIFGVETVTLPRYDQLNNRANILSSQGRTCRPSFFPLSAVTALLFGPGFLNDSVREDKRGGCVRCPSRKEIRNCGHGLARNSRRYIVLLD